MSVAPRAVTDGEFVALDERAFLANRWGDPARFYMWNGAQVDVPIKAFEKAVYPGKPEADWARVYAHREARKKVSAARQLWTQEWCNCGIKLGVRPRDHRTVGARVLDEEWLRRFWGKLAGVTAPDVATKMQRELVWLKAG